MLPAVFRKDNKRPSDPAFAGTGSVGRTLPVVAAWNRAARFGLSYHKETSTGQTVKIMLEAFWSPLRLKQTNLPEDRAEEKPWMILALSRGERGRTGGLGAEAQMFAQDNMLQTFAYNKEILSKAGGLEQIKGEENERKGQIAIKFRETLCVLTKITGTG